jgi:hypothetical protein
MTNAFLEPMIIKTESEKLIINAFSQKSLKKVHKRVLSVNNIFNKNHH